MEREQNGRVGKSRKDAGGPAKGSTRSVPRSTGIVTFPVAAHLVSGGFPLATALPA